MMSLGSFPSGILTTYPAQHSCGDNTMVETVGIPAWERTSCVGDLVSPGNLHQGGKVMLLVNMV